MCNQKDYETEKFVNLQLLFTLVQETIYANAYVIDPV